MLIEHLKADDINLRVTATRSLPAIADALGPERVRVELVPFINDSTDDEDEVRADTTAVNNVVVVGCVWEGGGGWDGMNVDVYFFG